MRSCHALGERPHQDVKRSKARQFGRYELLRLVSHDPAESEVHDMIITAICLFEPDDLPWYVGYQLYVSKWAA